MCLKMQSGRCSTLPVGQPIGDPAETFQERGGGGGGSIDYFTPYMTYLTHAGVVRQHEAADLVRRLYIRRFPRQSHLPTYGRDIWGNRQIKSLGPVGLN